MKTKMLKPACGIASVALAAFIFAACDSDSPSAPTGGDEKSSAVENSDAGDVSSSSDKVVASSDAGYVSSSSEGATVRCDALSTECGYTEEELCERGVPGYCGNELVEVSSSSETGQSSSSSSLLQKQCEAFMPECGYTEEELCKMGYTQYCVAGKCIDMDRMCPPCEGDLCPVTNVACNHCSEEGAELPDCKGGSDYVCSNRLWTQIKPTCEHITDYDGMSAEGNCVGRNGEVATDCATGEDYRCVANYWTRANACPPGGDCDGDGIPDGIRRPDLEPCDTDTLLEFYGRAYQCVNNKWVYLPPPITYINEKATDVSAMHRGGPAVAPRVVKVESASGSVTFRDDGVLVDDRCIFDGLNAELRGDTLFATILYPGCTTTGGSMGVITFTLGVSFADVKYIKYSGETKTKPVYEAEELLPCGNTSSCNTCSGDRDGATGC